MKYQDDFVTEEMLNRRYPDVNTLQDVVRRVDFSEYSLRDYDVFISHSYKNKPAIARLQQLFEERNFRAFVDWDDLEFDNRALMNREIAEKLREYIKICKCLVYVDTMEAEDSAWCPWELGFSDAYTAGRCFVMPPLDGVSANCKHEYLKLYDLLRYSDDKGFYTDKGNLYELISR